jgi:hypothetical protein
LSEAWQRWRQQRRSQRTSASTAASGRILKPTFGSKPAVARSEKLSDAEFMAREVDPILEKIARDGIGSLTAAERQILEDARKKVARR